MTFLSENEIHSIASVRGTEDRTKSLLRSYFWSRFVCEFVELKGDTLYFKDTHEKIHTLPFLAFKSGEYARCLIQIKLRQSEVEFQLQKEQEPVKVPASAPACIG